MPVNYEHATESARPARSLWDAVRKGARSCCPSCGRAGLFSSYLKVTPACGSCGEELHHHRADDAPPYFTIFIIGHIIVAMVLAAEAAFHPPIWLHGLVWLPVTLALALLTLPVVKGVLVGWQWALYMHGFDPDSPEHDDPHIDDGILSAHDRHR